VRVPWEEPDKARKAAEILARRLYGRRGICRTLNLESWAPDGSSRTYQAFLGTPADHGVVVGDNFWIYV
jgi:hypothetical protein